MSNPVIGLLDTPPCLVLALANDEGYTAYCHTDLTHTVPGVLMLWIAGRPTFLCNTHFPHDGIYTVAHCAAPRKMNGKDYEPTGDHCSLQGQLRQLNGESEIHWSQSS